MFGGLTTDLILLIEHYLLLSSCARSQLFPIVCNFRKNLRKQSMHYLISRKNTDRQMQQLKRKNFSYLISSNLVSNCHS